MLTTQQQHKRVDISRTQFWHLNPIWKFIANDIEWHQDKQ